MLKNIFYKYRKLSFVNQSLILIPIFIISFGIYYKYQLHKNEYLVDRNHEIYSQYDWNTWIESFNWNMTNDPKWLSMIPKHYIPKEKSFKFSFMEKIQPAHVKNLQYFEHLCRTENISYITIDYPEDNINNTFIDINNGELPVKGMSALYNALKSEETPLEEKEKIQKQINNIWNVTKQNPYVYSTYILNLGNLKENKIYDLFLNEIKNPEEYYITNKDNLPIKTTFREYLDDEGYVWRVRYDSENQQYRPIEKDTQIKAQYNNFLKKTQNSDMRKLGIWRVESFTIDIVNNKVMSYKKTFTMPNYFKKLRNTQYQLPIDWDNSISCPELDKQKFIIESFS